MTTAVEATASGASLKRVLSVNWMQTLFKLQQDRRKLQICRDYYNFGNTRVKFYPRQIIILIAWYFHAFSDYLISNVRSLLSTNTQVFNGDELNK